MGKIKQGILGGFNGTTGSVVGASWKGIPYMRGKAQSIKNPRTASQMLNRRNFGLISDLMSKALTIVNEGYLAVSVKKSPFNTAVHDNMKSIFDSHGDLDLEKAQFSNGPLIAPSAGSVTSAESSITAVVNAVGNQFDGNTLVSAFVFVDSSDKPIIVIPSRIPITGGAQTATAVITEPANLDYSSVMVFSFVFDSETKKASPTIFVGSPE